MGGILACDGPGGEDHEGHRLAGVGQRPRDGAADGLQIEAPISTADKIRLLNRLVATGVRRIEAASFVSPTAVPSLADVAQLAEHVLSLPGVQWSALVAGPGGARRALAAGITDLQLVVSASDGHSLANVRRSTDQALGTVEGIAASVHDVGGRYEVVVAVACDCPFAPGASGNITTEELVYLLDDAGVRTGIDLEAALDAARLAQELVGHPLDSALLRAGGRSVPSGPRD